jgi:hypothetical protein
MERHGLVFLVHHRQADAPALRLVQQFAILFPSVQGGQGVKLTLDGPVSANDGVGSPHQPDAHHLLQQIGLQQPIRKIQASFKELPAQGLFGR